MNDAELVLVLTAALAGGHLFERLKLPGRSWPGS